MKNILVACSCLVICISTGFQISKWSVFKVDNAISVLLPSKVFEMDVPKSMAANGHESASEPMVQKSQAYRAEDKVAIYVVVKIPLDEIPAIPASPNELQKFYARQAGLIVARARGQLIQQFIVRKPKLDILYVKYKQLDSTGIPVTRHMANCVIGKNIYQFYFSPKNSANNWHEGQSKRFLNSINRVGS